MIKTSKLNEDKYLFPAYFIQNPASIMTTQDYIGKGCTVLYSKMNFYPGLK